AEVDTLDDRLTAPARQDGDAPDARFFAPGAWGPEAGAREHRRDDDLHLELRKGGTEAAAHATTERNPGIGLGGAFEEALGPEGVRIGRIQRGVVLHEEDRGCQLSPRLEAITAQF